MKPPGAASPLHVAGARVEVPALKRDWNMDALHTLRDPAVDTMIPRGVFVLVLLAAAGWADPLPESTLDDCFKKDSISCVQIQLFRNAKSFFNQESVELFGGLSLVKNPSSEDKSARALEESSESQLLSASDAGQREDLLESYALGRVSSFLQQRSLSWNLSPVVNQVAATARSLAESIPPEVKGSISEFIAEGRGKKKKLMKALLPLLIGLKVKLAAFAGLAYVVIALIAKKALLASLISLAISGFIAIRKLLSQQHHAPAHHEVQVAHPVEYSSHGGGGGWSGGSGGGYSGGGGGGWDSYSGGGHGDSHGSYSNNVAHSIAYSAQKPVRRR